MAVNKRAVLETLPADVLREFADEWDADVQDRRRIDDLIDGLMRRRALTLDRVLEHLAFPSATPRPRKPRLERRPPRAHSSPKPTATPRVRSRSPPPRVVLLGSRATNRLSTAATLPPPFPVHFAPCP